MLFTAATQLQNGVVIWFFFLCILRDVGASFVGRGIAKCGSHSFKPVVYVCVCESF